MTRTFVDASVLVAIVGLESDVIEQGSRLRDAPMPVTSAIGI